MYSLYKDRLLRTFAEIKDNFLFFDCPNEKCEHKNEICLDDDKDIKTMVLDSEYPYCCTKCNLHLEIVIY